MHRKTRTLTILLVCFITLAGLPVGARAALTSPAAPQAMDGAAAERERGRVLLRRGQAGEALIHLEKALKLFQQNSNRLGEASVEDLMGELYERQGRFDVALTHYSKAYDLFNEVAREEASQPQLLANIGQQAGAYSANLMLAKIGSMYFRQGDAERARRAYSQMKVVKPDKDPLKSLQGGQSSVNKLKGIGRGFGGILGGKPSTSSPTAAASTLNNTARTLTGPRDAYRQTVIYTTYELGMGRVDFLNNQLNEARVHFQNVLDATLGNIPFIGKLGQTRRYRVAARTSLGDIAFIQARYSDAIKLYAEAAKGAQDDGRLDLMWPAQRGTGKSLWYQAAREKDAKKAAALREQSISAYREALKSIEAIRQGSLRGDEARTTFLATTKDVYDEAAGALAETALVTQPAAATGASQALAGPALDYAAEALRISEQGRARSLLDMLAETGTEITEGLPPELLRRKQENQQRQEEIAAQLTGVNLSREAPTKTVEELETELAQLQTEFESIENEIRAASPRYAALTATQPLTLADIQQKVLDDETALLEYSLGGDRSYLWAVTREGLALYRLPGRAEVEKQVMAVRDQIIPSSLRRSLDALTMTEQQRGLAERGLAVSSEGGAAAAASAATYANVAHALYKSVVEPAASFVGQRRLLIAADGALNYVPFPALVTAQPAAGADFTTLSYLLRTNESLFTPSATVVAAIRQQQAAQGGGRGGGMLLVADPIFDGSDARARGGQTAAPDGGGEASRALSFASAVDDLAAADAGGTGGAGAGRAETPAGGIKLARLQGTRTEAQEIAKLASTTGRKADLWLDFDASEPNIQARDLRAYRVLHFATHGLLNTERPQFSGVVLTLVNNQGGKDGFLRTDEIFNLKLSSPLVMLSACETGLGREKRGEGVIGLTRAFMYAGAPTVGVSLWSVADRSTAELMTDFYRNLLAKDGTPPTAAMRAARLNMIAGKKYSAPFYWAPFVLVGDWR